MKRTLMIAAGLGVLSAMATARAQAPATSPPAAIPPAAIPAAQPVVPTLPDQMVGEPALATPEGPVAVPVAPAPVEGNAYAYPVWMTKVGAAVMLGGGYEDFTQSGPRSVTKAGAAGTRQFIGLEAAYVGGARSIQLLGVPTNTNLVNNGVEGVVRVNVPIVMGPSLLEPFVFGGVGWQHYSVTKTVSTADLTASDDVMTVPFGGGVMVAYRRLMLDARVTWRETYNNDLFSAENSKLNTWGAGGNVGVEF
jgi:hypothetical protein